MIALSLHTWSNFNCRFATKVNNCNIGTASAKKSAK